MAPTSAPRFQLFFFLDPLIVCTMLLRGLQTHPGFNFMLPPIIVEDFGIAVSVCSLRKMSFPASRVSLSAVRVYRRLGPATLKDTVHLSARSGHRRGSVSLSAWEEMLVDGP